MRWDQPEPAEGAVHKQAGRRWRRRQLFKSDVGTKTKDANPIGDQYSCVSHQENREGRRLPGPSREVLSARVPRRTQALRQGQQLGFRAHPAPSPGVRFPPCRWFA